MKLQISSYKYRFLLGVLVLGLAGTSCKKYLETGIPPNAIGSEQAFSDSATATSSTLGIYSSIISSNSSAMYYAITFGAMSADEGYFLLNTTYDNLKNNVLAAGNDGNTLWSAVYARIGRANYAIEGLTAATGLSTPVKNQLLGEAKFWRAWLYFYLSEYFGDVPLTLTTKALEEGLTPRTPLATVRAQIVKDLTEAKALLTDKYPSTERARINKKVVSAFLSRVYLYTSNWAGAEAEATEVIGSGTYSIVTNLDNVFLNTSNETIWQLSLVNTSGTAATVFGAQFIPSTTLPTFVLYDTLAKTFEANDQRKASWAKPIAYDNKTFYYPYKYKVRTTTTGNEYPVMLRLGEVYLNRAEARAQQENVSGAQADLNVVRKRAGLGDTEAADKPTLLTALLHERWVELFTETADRWFNLKRTDKATEVLSLIKPQWKAFQQLYPIPAQSMNANPNLKDNDGYTK
jgi:hypothetical protein